MTESKNDLMSSSVARHFWCTSQDYEMSNFNYSEKNILVLKVFDLRVRSGGSFMFAKVHK